MSEFNDDFEEIRVTEMNQSDNGWNYLVELGYGDGLNEYMVEVDVAYWTRLTGRRIEPDELVKMTFNFLLDKEQLEERTIMLRAIKAGPRQKAEFFLYSGDESVPSRFLQLWLDINEG